METVAPKLSPQTATDKEKIILIKTEVKYAI